jgi:uncharacterized delta-60 repeat protein
VSYDTAVTILMLPTAYNPNGSLDATFGDAGQVTTNSFIASIAASMDVAADGKIVFAGPTDRGCLACSNFALARYNPDGSLDTSFGDEG